MLKKNKYTAKATPPGEGRRELILWDRRADAFTTRGPRVCLKQAESKKD